MKRFTILIVYFLFLWFKYFFEIYGDDSLKITTVFSKTGDAVLASSYLGGKFLVLGNIDYGLDRYIEGNPPDRCFIDYLYITPEANLVTFYRLLERCGVGTVFYREKDFYARKINLKLRNILKTQDLGNSEDEVEIDLNGVSVRIYRDNRVEFGSNGISFFALGSKESMGVEKLSSESVDYLKPPFNAANASINPLSAKNVLCSFKICLRNPEDYEIPGVNIIRSEDGESIVIKR